MGRQQRGDIADSDVDRAGRDRAAEDAGRYSYSRRHPPARLSSSCATVSTTPTVQSIARRTREQQPPSNPPSSIRTGETDQANPFFKRKSVGQAVSRAALVRYVAQKIAPLSPGWAAVVTAKPYGTSRAAGMDQSRGPPPFRLLSSSTFRPFRRSARECPAAVQHSPGREGEKDMGGRGRGILQGEDGGKGGGVEWPFSKSGCRNQPTTCYLLPAPGPPPTHPPRPGPEPESRHARADQLAHTSPSQVPRGTHRENSARQATFRKKFGLRPTWDS